MNNINKLYELDRISAIDPSAEFIKKIVGLFLEAIPTEAEELEKACRHNDWATAYKYAHKMRPNIELVNIASIISDIKWLEQETRKTHPAPDCIIKAEKVKSIIHLCELQMQHDFFADEPILA